MVAGLLAAVVLVSRNAAYRRIHDAETADTDHDGVPDIYQARAGLTRRSRAYTDGMLEQIRGPADLQHLSQSQLSDLAARDP